jgi:hypothetical protein
MATTSDPDFYLATPESTTGTKKQNSAAAIVEDWLNSRGLYGLGEWAWQRILDGASPDELYLEVRDQPQYKARFPAMEELSKSGRAMSEDQYIAYEKNVRELLQRYAVPAGMYDTPEGMKGLILSDVSPAEVNERLTLATSAAYQAPQEVRDALVRNYGVSAGDMTGFYLDPDKAMPLLEQQYRSAQVSGAAAITGVGTALSQAERLAAQGVTFDQALAGFDKVAQTEGLAGALGGETISEAERTDATFTGGAQRTKMERVQQSRAASFTDQGGAVADREGVTGLGSNQ